MRLFTEDLLKNIIKSNRSTFYVYGLWRPDKQELFYIGKGHKYRIFEHFKSKSLNTHKINTINKVGRENIRFWIKFCNSEAEAFQEEIRLIKEYRKTLCNITDGGEGCSGRKMSEERRLKLSKINTGKIISKETRLKISLTSKGREVSGDTRLKLSLYHKNMDKELKTKLSEIKRNKMILYLNSFLKTDDGKLFLKRRSERVREVLTGKICSEETKRKMKENRKPHKHTEDSKLKIGEASKKAWANNPNRRIISEEVKIKIGIKSKGRKVSLEQKRKVSESLKNYYKDKPHPQSEETKRKLSISVKAYHDKQRQLKLGV